MKKQIYDEKNGMGYTLHGDYYLPDLVLREEKPTYGKYGMLLITLAAICMIKKKSKSVISIKKQNPVC